jgi:hypothetical protein
VEGAFDSIGAEKFAHFHHGRAAGAQLECVANDR